jgi:hypothetical protein
VPEIVTGLEFAEWHLDGSDPVSIGADSGVWRRALRSPRVRQDFVRRKVVDDDDIVALELGARPDEVFATHRRRVLLMNARLTLAPAQTLN